MRRLSCIVVLIFFASIVNAATYYLSTSGSDANNGSTGARWATLGHAFGIMGPGDTLIVEDGTYNQRMTSMPSGTPGSYVTIQAEHDGGATFEITQGNLVLYINGRSYVKVQGFKFSENAVDSTENVAFISGGSHHNKIINCGFVKNPTTTNSNVANFTVSGSSNLIEGCYAWGGGRYKFIAYGGDEPVSAMNGCFNVFRRCVVRHDREYAGGFNPQAAFCSYQAGYTFYQNCVVLDSNYPIRNEPGYAAEPYYDGLWSGPWYLEKGQKGGPIVLQGCIAINYSALFVSDSPSGNNSDPMYTAGPLTFRDCAAINGYTGIPIVYNHPNRPIVVDHCVFGNLSGRQVGDYQHNEFGFTGGPNVNVQSVATNSIFYGMNATANGGGGALLRVGGANDYNCFWNNLQNRVDSTAGAHDMTGTNPLTASLLYPVRVESGSALSGAGASGSDIGPTILKRIGVPGTLYGEAGWDTVTGEDLWPFPNEERIRTDMSSYPSNWPAGNLPSPTRGFCASGQTLTKYIWETLGNPLPSGMYSLAPPMNLAPVDITSSTITLSWRDNSYIEDGFRVERKTGAGGIYSQVGTAGPNATEYTDEGLSASTTYFYRAVAYIVSPSSTAYSNEVSALTYDYGLNPPTNLVAVALSSAAISLSWADNDYREKEFKIERKNGAAGVYAQISTVTANTISYIDYGLNPDTTYFYRVRTYNDEVSNSKYSNVSSAVTYTAGSTGGGDGGGGNPDTVGITAGDIKIIGSTKNRGIINPDEGDTAKIYFKGTGVGLFECRIFTLTGEQVWQDSIQNVSQGIFEWVPKNVASGGYVVFVKGPGLNVKKKVAVIR